MLKSKYRDDVESLIHERLSPAGDFGRRWPDVQTSARLVVDADFRPLDRELAREATCALGHRFRQKKDKDIHAVAIHDPQLHAREVKRGIMYSGDNCVWVVAVPSFTQAKDKEQHNIVARLEEAANKIDEHAFHDALNDIKWEEILSTDFIYVIKLALKMGLPLTAREISSKGMKYHSDNAELSHLAQVLAPPRVLSSDLPPDPSQRVNRAWLKAHRHEHRGKWVAVKDGELLGAADSLKELTQRIGNTEDVLLTKA